MVVRMMDQSRIEPGQRYAWWHTRGECWSVAYCGEHGPGMGVDESKRHPIVEPERLHEIKVGSTVLNVATGEQFEWTGSDVREADWWQRRAGRWHTPLLALVANPEEDA